MVEKKKKKRKYVKKVVEAVSFSFDDLPISLRVGFAAETRIRERKRLPLLEEERKKILIDRFQAGGKR